MTNKHGNAQGLGGSTRMRFAGNPSGTSFELLVTFFNEIKDEIPREIERDTALKFFLGIMRNQNLSNKYSYNLKNEIMEL